MTMMRQQPDSSSTSASASSTSHIAAGLAAPARQHMPAMLVPVVKLELVSSEGISIEQVEINDVITLSLGNIYHVRLLRTLNSNLILGSPFTSEELDKQDKLSDHRWYQAFPELISIHTHCHYKIDDLNILTAYFREFYMRSYGNQPDPAESLGDWQSVFHTSTSAQAHGAVELNEDDLARLIANDIAFSYYRNGGLNFCSITIALLKFFPNGESLERLSDSLIQKMVSQHIDNGRYPLFALLPEPDIIKKAVDELKLEYQPFYQRWYQQFMNWLNKPLISLTDPLAKLKGSINGIFNQYISWWKFSWFGHHHDGRARAVNQAIQNSRNIDEIRNILQRQQQVVTDCGFSVLTFWNNPRWNDKEKVINRVEIEKDSGYCRAVNTALQEVSTHVEHHLSKSQG